MRENKKVIICLIIALVLLFINLVSTISSYIDYNNRKESGNTRWNQVEERIEKIEDELNNLKNEVEQWKS